MSCPHAVIIGAGIPGLSTAWFLQEWGYNVTVMDEKAVAGGSTWGNAGWISPALTLPLNEPAVLRAGIRAALSPASPVYVPPTASPRLIRFLASFAAHCTPRRWTRAMELYVDANRQAVGAYEDLVAGGVDEPMNQATPFLACFVDGRQRAHLVDELLAVRRHGGGVDFQELDADELHRLEPALGDAVTSGLALEGQYYIDPGRFARALAASIRRRGGEVVEGTRVVGLYPQEPGGVRVTLSDEREMDSDVAVLATGATLSAHARRFGVRTPVQAGRGYSFTVTPRIPPVRPLYFPAQRVACTPMGDALRVAGMMEFRRPGAPLDPRRVRAIIDAASPLLSGVEWEHRVNEWVGSRPCTPDGLPLVGATTAPGVFVIGGHGMWGIALGPLSGRLLAGQIATGRRPGLLSGFDPLR